MQNKISNTNKILLTFGCFVAFFLFGVTDNLKGPTLPPMIAELNIDYGTGGNIFFTLYFGFLVATLLTGILADKYGLKIVVLLASVMLAIGTIGYSSMQTASLLSLSLFIMGLGLGGYELGINATIVNLYKEQKGLFLNLTAVMHGLGSTIAPLVASWFLAQGVLWRALYFWDFLLILAFIAFTLFTTFPKTEESNSLDFKSLPQVAFKSQMPLYYASILFYVAAEIGLGSWLVLYLQDIKNLSVTISNQQLAIFFALLMAGRLVGGFFVQRLGYLLSIVITASLSAICLAIGIFTSYYFFFAIAGFFFSIIFPTITAAVSDTYHENINSILGMLFTFAGIGGVLGPWLIAWASEFFNLQIGFSLTLILTLLTLLCMFILLRNKQYEKDS